MPKIKPATARQKKISKVMEEFRRWMLKSSSWQRVTSERQAKAIALSEANRLPGRKSKSAMKSMKKFKSKKK